jgi:hypothetical protein
MREFSLDLDKITKTIFFCKKVFVSTCLHCFNAATPLEVDRVCLSRIKMVNNVNSLEGLHIDLSMEKILLEYPLECLPSKLNKRTGKALRCPFEAIDLNLYEEGARITFHTTLPRIQPWLKVLSIFYYDNLGKQDNIKLSWSDIPETWSDRHDAANCILIEVKNLDETLKYNLTFFVTTGTIRAQGSQYRLFTDKHFPT